MSSLPQSEAPIPSNTVLVVDDEPVVRTLITRHLSDAGFDVIQAENGSDAVAQFFQHQARIVGLVLDLMMPGSRGEVALSMIRAVAPDLPVIIATGTQPEDDVRYRPVGEPEVSVLLKPIEASVLVGELQRLIKGE